MATKQLTGAPTRADHHRPTAPLPAGVESLACGLDVKLASPADLLRAQIGRLEESLWIQSEGIRADLATMRDLSLPELDRAAAEGSFHSTMREIASLRHQIRLLEAALGALARYTDAEVTYRMLAKSTAWMAPGEYDRMLCVVDAMAGARAELKTAGMLHLIGGGV
ncbi:hypothetical protein ADK57_25965 [Streptomyces sp. MMG1533]|uniref:hypothetical protein n=1 Tax=Streptomyces sp. MMG1533 TaxID=1415546 RepID=UPI0006AF38C8|nr:hypothetical protein [Streptomyces sp. MMG1533]KOU62080.1 hypothetical protein ADK57_25965 [Streptomyces sp. MMG1533]